MSSKGNMESNNNNNNCGRSCVLRNGPVWRYKVADNVKTSDPCCSTTLFKEGQLETLRILLKEPTMMNQIRVESVTEVSSPMEEPLKQQQLVPSTAETEQSFEPQETTENEQAESKSETVYNLESGNMLYVRFPLGIPPVSEVMKLHPRITNVLLSVYDAARFCYLLFPSKDEAEDARRKLAKLESSGKIIVSLDKSLDNIIAERTTKLLPVLSRMRRRRRNGVCQVFSSQRRTSRNLKQEKQEHEEQHRQRIRLLNVKEHALIHEIRFLNQSLMCLRKQKFLLKMRKSEVTHKLDKLWEKKMMIRAIQH